MRAATFFAPLLALCALVTAAGCAGSLPDINLPPVREIAPAREFPSLRDYRGIIDCRLRPTGITQSKLADLAHDAQIDFVCLGDRAREGSADYGIAGFTGELLIVPGASFSAGNDGAEVIGLNLRHPIDPHLSAAAIIEAIHRQNGLAVAAAPAEFRSPDDYALADAMEVYSLADAWSAQSPAAMYTRALLLGPDRFFSALDLRSDRNFAAYDTMARGARISLIAGLGSERALSVLGTRVGTFRQLFEVCTTHILASERQIDPLTDALRRGHSYVSFDILGYVPDFAFYAESGGSKVMMGDEASFSSGTKLKVELPASADEIAIFHDGVRAASTENASDFEYSPTQPGAWRVEAYRRGRPWILSNPVYLR
jgi:hypothetical protein